MIKPEPWLAGLSLMSWCRLRFVRLRAHTVHPHIECVYGGNVLGCEFRVPELSEPGLLPFSPRCVRGQQRRIRGAAAPALPAAPAGLRGWKYGKRSENETGHSCFGAEAFLQNAVKLKCQLFAQESGKKLPPS